MSLLERFFGLGKGMSSYWRERVCVWAGLGCGRVGPSQGEKIDSDVRLSLGDCPR